LLPAPLAPGERGGPGAAAVRTLAAHVEAMGGRLEVSADTGTGRGLR
jgi:hypothetical protein